MEENLGKTKPSAIYFILILNVIDLFVADISCYWGKSLIKGLQNNKHEIFVKYYKIINQLGMSLSLFLDFNFEFVIYIYTHINSHNFWWSSS